jgi:hypothetical protein
MSMSPPGFPVHDLDHQASANRRFVVQLRIDADVVRGLYRGRVQHVRSGEAAHFESLDELAAFFAAMAVKERGDTLLGTPRGGPAP